MNKLFSDLPEWLDLEAWGSFLEMRKMMRKPLTDRAVGMIIKRLNALRLKGENTTDVLDQSTMVCWLNIYPVRKENGNGTGKESATNLAIRNAKALGLTH